MGQGGPESYVDRLVNEMLERHPWPWRFDWDWTGEVLDANNRIVQKFRTQAAAEGLIAHAARLDAENKRAAEETAKFLRDAGLEP